MKRKPVVFLSHSKRDKVFIQKIAGDLRNARIDCWYDDWEIPPGEPFMRKIFDEGLPESDLFFVYLSENTINSYWVEKELDSAILLDKDKAGGFMATFIDNEATRSKLRIDLRTIHAPVLNETEYFEPFYKLLSRCWEGNARRLIELADERRELELVKLQRENEELKLKIVQSQKEVDKNRDLKSFLENQIVEIDSKKMSLKEIFRDISMEIRGSWSVDLIQVFRKQFLEETSRIDFEFFDINILKKLEFARLVEVDQIKDQIWLTELGSEMALKLFNEEL